MDQKLIKHFSTNGNSYFSIFFLLNIKNNAVVSILTSLFFVRFYFYCIMVR